MAPNKNFNRGKLRNYYLHNNCLRIVLKSIQKFYSHAKVFLNRVVSFQAMIYIYIIYYTLGAETFASRNFREFREFCLNSRKFKTRKILY